MLMNIKLVEKIREASVHESFDSDTLAYPDKFECYRYMKMLLMTSSDNDVTSKYVTH